MSLSFGEIAVIAITLAIIFSASRMSALGNALGKFVYSFKKASKGAGFVDAPKTLQRDSRAVEDAQLVDRKP
ncbi:MAG: twin-arginine translocase TatA/TatE family subunit [Myxococcaceae bacterium]|nr:twin-arginine translocase TatA/TatE family subunit [Myxococcaceae bacterium]